MSVQIAPQRLDAARTWAREHVCLEDGGALDVTNLGTGWAVRCTGCQGLTYSTKPTAAAIQHKVSVYQTTAQKLGRATPSTEEMLKLAEMELRKATPAYVPALYTTVGEALAPTATPIDREIAKAADYTAMDAIIERVNLAFSTYRVRGQGDNYTDAATPPAVLRQLVLSYATYKLDPLDRWIIPILSRGNWAIYKSTDFMLLKTESHPTFEGWTRPDFLGTDAKAAMGIDPEALAVEIGMYRKGWKEPVWGLGIWNRGRSLNGAESGNTPQNMAIKAARRAAIKVAFPQFVSNDGDEPATGSVYVEEVFDPAGYLTEATTGVEEPTPGEGPTGEPQQAALV